MSQSSAMFLSMRLTRLRDTRPPNIGQEWASAAGASGPFLSSLSFSAVVEPAFWTASTARMAAKRAPVPNRASQRRCAGVRVMGSVPLAGHPVLLVRRDADVAVVHAGQLA